MHSEADTEGRRSRLRKGPGVLANTFVNILGIGGAHGLSALSGLITARVLGPVGVGVLAVSFGLVEFGRSLSNFTHAPSIIEYHRGSEPRRVFGTSLVLKVLGSLAFLAIAAAASPFLAQLFEVPWWAIVLAASGLLVGAFYEIGSAKHEADNRMVRRNVLLGLGPALGLVLVSALALTGRLTVLTSILTTVAAVATMSLAFVLDEPTIYRPRFDRKIGRYLFDYGSRIVLASLLTQGLLWTDTLMVSVLLGNEATGVYNIVFQLTYVMVTASVAIGVALMPALSELHGRGEDTTRGFQRGTLIAFAMSGVITLFFLAAGPFILAIYGPGFVQGTGALYVLLLFGMAASLAVPASSLLTVHGHAGWMTLISLGQLVLNVPLNYVLIQAVGMTGAAISTTLVFVVGTILMWILVHRTTGAAPVSRDVIEEAWVELRDRVGGMLG